MGRPVWGAHARPVPGAMVADVEFTARQHPARVVILPPISPPATLPGEAQPQFPAGSGGADLFANHPAA